MRIQSLSSSARRLIGTAGSILLACVAASNLAPSHAQSPTLRFAGSALDRARAVQMARQGGGQLLDFRACRGAVGQAAGCVRLAVRDAGGRARVLQLSDSPCRGGGASCFAGYTVIAQLGSGRGAAAGEPRGSERRKPGPRSGASAAKVSAKPGENGAPPDPQDEAQADATNEIIEALGDGKYEGNYDRFWRDLESIQTWDTPTWYEPDHAPVSTDQVSITGRFGKVNPAVLISGRYEASNAERECRSWVSYTSSGSPVANLGNWMGNAPFDGCDSEVAVFSENGGALLDRPEGRWSKGRDDLDYAPPATIKIPTSVWVVYAQQDYAAEEERIKDEFGFANEILTTSRCGIELQPTYFDKTAALADPAQELGCASIESTLKKVGFHPNKMNVYLVKALIADDRAGVACRAESDNVIILDPGRNRSSLAHEYGHWFDLWHTNTTDMPLVNVRNIMSDEQKDQRNMLTAGQCYRANFSDNSYINLQKLRDGKTKRCAHKQEADGECPGLKNTF
jgi:hypothetical protein